ncbi:MAG: histidine kinase, partial [Bacteroidales bacterium]|nr:histidine kinase [Bacteroidales bacterium]
NYSVVNGLPFPEFNTNAHFMAEDGTIYFGGEGGVVAFHPDSLVNFEISAPLGIQTITADNGLFPMDYPLRDGTIVELPYHKNSFTITFSAFDLRHPQDRIYRYKLAGQLDKWEQNMSGDLTAHFAGIKPGTYIFELQSTYKGWPWILENTNVQIIVAAPPFYLTGTFRIVIALIATLALLAVVLLLIRNYKIRKEVQISRLEREANQSKLNFLKSQMNPHFYFNSLNSINSFVLKSDIRSANKFLTTFANLMREILDNSNKEFVSIEEEKEVLDKYIALQQLRFPGVFDYRTIAEDQVKQRNIPPMLIQPFVENAIEYAFVKMPVKGLINVDFGLVKNKIVCTITDNGIGIENSQKLRAGRIRKSAAIKNITQRIDMLNKIYGISISLKFTQVNPTSKEFPGTRISIILPDI